MTQSDMQLPRSRTWTICGLLLLASAINYMDRQTLANAAVRISREFEMSQEQYGNLEAGFGWAFAAGSLFFGFLADKVSLRWLYAAVLLLWSAMGFASGFARNYEDLLIFRTLLGFFEAGHWPCGIKTIRAVGCEGTRDGQQRASERDVDRRHCHAVDHDRLAHRRRRQLATPVSSGRRGGALWAVAWIALAPSELPAHASEKPEAAIGWWRILFDRRMLVILTVVALINTTWQMLRAWLPKFLQEGRGFEEGETLLFNSVWFVATDIGCLGAGAVALWLARRGQSVVRARLLTFLACALMCLATLAIPWLPQGWLLLATLLIAGAGALGVFPLYHAFTQDVSHHHQGKVTGIAGVAAWAFSPVAHRLFGRHIDETQSFDQGLVVAGCLPLLAFFVLAFFWPRTKAATHD